MRESSLLSLKDNTSFSYSLGFILYSSFISCHQNRVGIEKCSSEVKLEKLLVRKN